MPDLGTDLLVLLKEANNHDLTLVGSGGEQLKVHQFILEARSVVFKKMMNVDMEEKRTGIVEINDFDIEVVTGFVNYLYSDKISENFSVLPELLQIGHKYEVSSLIDECSKRLEKELTVTNVVQMGSLAEAYQVSQLSDKCANFLAENWDIIEPELLYNAPGRLLCKTTTAMSKRKLKYCQIPIFDDVEKKTQYPTNFSTNLENSTAIRSDTPIVTWFEVKRDTLLAGIGLFINDMEDLPIEFSLSWTDPHDEDDDGCLDEETFSLNALSHNMERLKPLRLMLPVPVLIDRDYKYRVQVKFGKDIVNKTCQPEYKKKVCSLPMLRGNLDIDVHANPEIPVLFFEEYFDILDT